MLIYKHVNWVDLSRLFSSQTLEQTTITRCISVHAACYNSMIVERRDMEGMHLCSKELKTTKYVKIK